MMYGVLLYQCVSVFTIYLIYRTHGKIFGQDFNLKNISPGCHLTVDECMSAWKGPDGEYVAEGMPHKTKIARKPEGVGAEMKALACGEAGIILKLDVRKERFLTGIW